MILLTDVTVRMTVMCTRVDCVGEMRVSIHRNVTVSQTEKSCCSGHARARKHYVPQRKYQVCACAPLRSYGGTVAWLVRLIPDRAVRVGAPRHFSLTMPLLTHLNTYAPENVILGVALR